MILARNRNFRLLFSASVMSNLGDGISALPLRLGAVMHLSGFTNPVRGCHVRQLFCFGAALTMSSSDFKAPSRYYVGTRCWIISGVARAR